MRRLFIAASLFAMTACDPPIPPVNPNDGYWHLARSGTFTCPAMPISIDANRTDITLDGSCKGVRINGSRNDLVINVVPNATIEVNGNRNSVGYRPIVRGAKPRWINNGDRNQLTRSWRLVREGDDD
jgi:hypothetical protein